MDLGGKKKRALIASGGLKVEERPGEDKAFYLEAMYHALE